MTYISRPSGVGARNVGTCARWVLVPSGSVHGVTLVEGDGLNELLSSVSSNRGDAGDPFPGSTARTHLGNDAGSPSTALNAGKRWMLSVPGGRWSEARSTMISTDSARTFKKFSDNPILRTPATNDRDPKVFFHKPACAWFMVLSLSRNNNDRDHATYGLFRSAVILDGQWVDLWDFGQAGDYSLEIDASTSNIDDQGDFELSPGSSNWTQQPSSALPPNAVGSVSGPIVLRNSSTEPGQPCVSSRGSAVSRPGKPGGGFSPSFSVRVCGAWSLAMASMVPSARPSLMAATSSAVRSGGFILALVL